MKCQKSFSYNVKDIPTLVIGSYNDQCVVMQAIKDNAKIHNAEILVLDNICHDMILDPDWEKIAKMILNFIKKDIDKKVGIIIMITMVAHRRIKEVNKWQLALMRLPMRRF